MNEHLKDTGGLPLTTEGTLRPGEHVGEGHRQVKSERQSH